MADPIAFEVKWNKEIERAIARAPTEALTRLAEATVAESIRRSPVSEGGFGGTNRRSIKFDTPSRGVRKIFTESGYGALLEIGTGMFGPKRKRIVPKTAKALSWIGPGGQRVFFKSVKGRPATPYMRPALEDVIRRAATILKGLVKE